MKIRSRAHAALAAALILLASAGCETLPPSTGAADADARATRDAELAETRKTKAGAAAKEREARQEKLAELERKLVKLARKGKAAAAELELAQRKADDERAAAALGVASAERDLANAEKALKGFSRFTLPLAQAESKLAVDRAQRRFDDSKEELKEILVLYEDEIDAVRAKEIVVARHRKSVEFAERALEIARLKARQAAEKDLVEQREKLEHAVQKAADSLAKVRSDAERQGMSAALDRLRKEHAILDVEEDVADTKRTLQELKDDADGAGNGDDSPAGTTRE
ncbi:MAG: hypothetical protein E2O39_03730 [Planctomycetota bacterium]|nr:MAG: hypothetical protein E2O39_03730 [Planctomycetota bacterium]